MKNQQDQGLFFDPEANSTKTEWIRNPMSFSEENKERILRIDYTHRDGPKDDDPDGSVNESRNLATVATAPSTDPPDENIDK